MMIGVLGGTGAQGRGLAYRWAVSGLAVIIGSRDEPRAKDAAEEIAAASGSSRITGADNTRCAAEADVVVVAVPYAAHESTLVAVRAELAGKVVVDCVNPLGFDGRGPFPLDVQRSAVERAQDLLPESRLVGAFHNVSAVVLGDAAQSGVDTDVLVLAEERDDATLVQALAERIPGVRGIYAGRLRNAGQVEALTANLIAINRRYKTHAGIRITGAGLDGLQSGL